MSKPTHRSLEEMYYAIWDKRADADAYLAKFLMFRDRQFWLNMIKKAHDVIQEPPNHCLGKDGDIMGTEGTSVEIMHVTDPGDEHWGDVFVTVAREHDDADDERVAIVPLAELRELLGTQDTTSTGAATWSTAQFEEACANTHHWDQVWSQLNKVTPGGLSTSEGPSWLLQRLGALCTEVGKLREDGQRYQELAASLTEGDPDADQWSHERLCTWTRREGRRATRAGATKGSQRMKLYAEFGKAVYEYQGGDAGDLARAQEALDEGLRVLGVDV